MDRTVKAYTTLHTPTLDILSIKCQVESCTEKSASLTIMYNYSLWFMKGEFTANYHDGHWVRFINYNVLSTQ